jgi:hypothetical protein
MAAIPKSGVSGYRNARVNSLTQQLFPPESVSILKRAKDRSFWGR